MTSSTVMLSRGKEKFVYDGFMYVLDKPSVDGMKLFWRCDRRHDGCKARLHTNAQTGQVCLHECSLCATPSIPFFIPIVDNTSIHEHNHSSNAASVDVARVKTTIKRRAEVTVEVVMCAVVKVVVRNLRYGVYF